MPGKDPLQLVGTVLRGAYAIDGLVRIEPSALVYRATHVTRNRSVAVRVLTSLSTLTEDARRARLNVMTADHSKLAELGVIVPAVYPTRDVGTAPTPHATWVPFVVIEWPHGVTLDQLHALPGSVEEIVQLLEPVAIALAIAHEHKVVHGAVTSDRVLFKDDYAGERKTMLLDFCAARAVRDADRPDDPVTPRDDVRGLASVLSETMGRALGHAHDPHRAHDSLATPRQRGVDVSDEIENVLARALSLSPTDRYEKVGDLWAELRVSLGLPSLRALTATIPPEGRSASLRPIAHSLAPPPPARERRSVGMTALAAGCVAALTVLTVMHLRTSESHPVVVSAAQANAPLPTPACASGMMAFPAATFTMGSATDTDAPLHGVSLSAFCVDRAAVTTSAYAACSEKGDCKRAGRTNDWPGITDAEHEAFDAMCRDRDGSTKAAEPINCVTWDMAAAYCAKRGARLPTEAEWELASRATPSSASEWVADWKAATGTLDARDPRGPASGEERVVRGAHAPGGTAERFGAAPSTRSHGVGFRCAL